MDILQAAKSALAADDDRAPGELLTVIRDAVQNYLSPKPAKLAKTSEIGGSIHQFDNSK
jgi:hypothetical protein